MNITIATTRLKPSYRVFNKLGFIVWVKKAGTHKPIKENKSMLEVVSTTFILKFCVLCFKPPINILAPKTSSIFPIIEPAIDDFTTSNKPDFKAKKEIISSVALPKVAFKNPPILGPV